MNLESIEFDAFVFNMRAAEKTQILQNLSWMIGRKTEADMTWLSEQLLLSEEKQNSAIGDGVAIAQVKSSPLTQPYVILAKLDRPVDFGADDGQEVDLVCVLVSAQMDGPLHLQRLSRLTRMFRDKNLLETIRAAGSEREMADLFREVRAAPIAA